MTESTGKDQTFQGSPSKKWSEVSCRSCNKLHSSFYFSCLSCKANYCLQCYNDMISTNKNCITCKSELNQFNEIESPSKDYSSDLIQCEYSQFGCKAILPYKDISTHKLDCPFTPYTCHKCKRTDMLIGSRLQHKNECEYEEINCIECKNSILRKDLAFHSHTQGLVNFVSCLSCKMIIQKDYWERHPQSCKFNQECKAAEDSFQHKSLCQSKELFKRIFDNELHNSYQTKMMRTDCENLHSECLSNKNFLQNLIIDLRENMYQENRKLNEKIEQKMVEINQEMIVKPLSVIEAKLNLHESQNTLNTDYLKEISGKIKQHDIDSNDKLASIDSHIQKSSEGIQKQINTDIQDSAKHINQLNDAQIKSFKDEFDSCKKILGNTHDHLLKEQSQLIDDFRRELKVDYSNIGNEIKNLSLTIISLKEEEKTINEKSMETFESNINNQLVAIKKDILINYNSLNLIVNDIANMEYISYMIKSFKLYPKIQQKYKELLDKKNCLPKTFQKYANDLNKMKEFLPFINKFDVILQNVKETFIKLPQDSNDFDSKTIISNLKTNYEKEFNSLALYFLFVNFVCYKSFNLFKITDYGTIIDEHRIISEQGQRKNYYLYYFEFKGKNLHIKSMVTSEKFIYELYYSERLVDSVFHQKVLFVCGGYDKGYYLNNCAILDIESKSIDNAKKLCEKKSNISLVSTGISLFCLGGWNEKDLNTCEYFNPEQKKWIKINSLNNSDRSITSSFDSTEYIYNFGGCHSNLYERFDTEILSGKWELLMVSYSSRRYYGNAFLLNEDQFIIFGGDYTKNNNFYLFNAFSQKLEKLNKEFTQKVTKFNSSKPFYFEESIWIVDKSQSEKIFKVNGASLEVEEFDINF